MKSNLAIVTEKCEAFAIEPTLEPKGSVQVKRGAKPKAYDPIFSRPFGAEGHTLGDAIEHEASVYKGLMRSKKATLEKLRNIGLVLIECRSLIGDSDKNFGIFLKKTPLSIMSRQDRSDAMWLAEQWANVQSFMKDMDISSCSASYLRKKIASVKKTDAPVQDKPKADVQQPKAENVQQPKAEPSVECPTVESTEVTVSVDTEEEFAESMLALAKSQGLDITKVIECLMQHA